MDFYPRKDKVVFIVGATGSGKSRLAVDLGTRFPAEIINSDKIQLYKGLDITTNKVTKPETRGVPHHLIDLIHDPDKLFSAEDFSHHALAATDVILARSRTPIIAGGSNSHIECLVDESPRFTLEHDICFLWVDVSLPVLRAFVYERVDRMVAAGMVEEVREIFDPTADYNRGLRRAIGAPELDGVFRKSWGACGGAGCRSSAACAVVESAVWRIKENTWRLAVRQVEKIRRLQAKWGRRYGFWRLDATDVFLRRGTAAAEEAWERVVAGPATGFVDDFLYGEGIAGVMSPVPITGVMSPVPIAAVRRR